MRLRDLIMVFASFASMTAGAFLPQLAGPLDGLPRLLLMFMLYLSFLTVGKEALWRELRDMPGTLCRLTLFRLVLLPLLCFAVFLMVMPEFALGAFLLGAAPVGVMAAVFSLMLRANTALILVGNIATSLLLPLSLPAMLSFTDAAVRLMGSPPLALPERFSLGGMTISLSVTILLPFAAACLTRSRLPRCGAVLLRHQFPLITSAIVISNLAIFSQYAGVLRQSPELIAQALLAACLLCVIMTVAAVPATRGMPRQIRLAFLISFGVINNILLMIVSTEFFGVAETLMAAAYLAPLYVLLFYYRYCNRDAPA